MIKMRYSKVLLAASGLLAAGAIACGGGGNKNATPTLTRTYYPTPIAACSCETPTLTNTSYPTQEQATQSAVPTNPPTLDLSEYNPRLVDAFNRISACDGVDLRHEYKKILDLAQPFYEVGIGEDIIAASELRGTSSDGVEEAYLCSLGVYDPSSSSRDLSRIYDQFGVVQELRPSMDQVIHATWIQGQNYPWTVDIRELTGDEFNALLGNDILFGSITNNYETSVSEVMKGGWNYMFGPTMEIINQEGATTQDDIAKAIMEWGQNNVRHIGQGDPSYLDAIQRPSAQQVYDYIDKNGFRVAGSRTWSSLAVAMLRSVNIPAGYETIQLIDGDRLPHGNYFLPSLDVYVGGNFIFDPELRGANLDVVLLKPYQAKGIPDKTNGILRSLAEYLDFLKNPEGYLDYLDDLYQEIPQ